MAKYAEGYPNSRYYQGCKYVDKIESLAIELAKKLFGAEHANVQPHSGAQANQAVYLALLRPGDTILSLDLLAGGHLTHGAKVNFSGTIYKIYCYNLDPDTQKLDYEKIRKKAREVRPKLIIAGYSSYSLKIDFAKFREIADEVGAFLLADIAHVAGLVATDLFPNPVPHADVITFTTQKTLRGPRGGVILSKKELGEKIDRAVFPGNQGGPNIATIAAKSQCFSKASQPEFKKYQKKVLENAKTMADYFLEKEIKVISGGTETHLLVIDTKTGYNLTGKEAAQILEKTKINASDCNFFRKETNFPGAFTLAILAEPEVLVLTGKEKSIKFLQKNDPLLNGEELKNDNPSPMPTDPPKPVLPYSPPTPTLPPDPIIPPKENLKPESDNSNKGETNFKKLNEKVV
ncbi:1607_t:CDS:2 [Paraglomus occultum]|uniref:glycine hydroxymethyltransferase n=1 Tax=Paraglomus occultum TaxID=144539 RepID=A0A9N9BQK2_9GLOM|nr:1607_t:CDS:2 [Paraglomus occultum]